MLFVTWGANFAQAVPVNVTFARTLTILLTTNRLVLQLLKIMLRIALTAAQSPILWAAPPETMNAEANALIIFTLL